MYYPPNMERDLLIILSVIALGLVGLGFLIGKWVG
jgi:hypothetical protein